ncbi:unnamed protein product [Amaranthus hypochondriacus]
MRDFPSCFGENAVQISDSSSSNGNKTAQNLVTCVYQCRIRGKSCLLTVSWSKNLMGQGLSIGIDDSSNQSLCKVEIKPWLFSKRKGSKCLEIESNNTSINIYWDFSSAKFGSGPEPLEGFYLAIVCDNQMVLLLGDMRKDAFKKTSITQCPNSAVFIAKKEHVYGRKVFYSRSRFSDNGPVHDLMIECDTISTNEPCLIVRVDTKNVLQVKRLRWKFRGNQAIVIDGLSVEFFWDVHSWLFGTCPGSAVFMFRTSVCSEKIWANQSVCDPSVLHWSTSQRFRDSQSNQYCFSLILYAWKQE